MASKKRRTIPQPPQENVVYLMSEEESLDSESSDGGSTAGNLVDVCVVTSIDSLECTAVSIATNSLVSARATVTLLPPRPISDGSHHGSIHVNLLSKRM